MSARTAGESRAGDVGVVVIGRNEGERLRRCLVSLQDVGIRAYVDSGSTDGSQDLARSLGFEVVEISTPPGFTAARARNAGLRRLLDVAPSLTFVQMVDGDCEVAQGWISAARQTLEGDSELAVVFGRLRERFPEATIYNWMCHHEWDGPVGEANACGGIAMFRIKPLVDSGGYTEALIAGEEPELCLRLRRQGWRIRRIRADMAFHDAAMRHFSQWWRRAQRAGHSYAELSFRHGANGDPNWIRQLSSTLVWAPVGLIGIACLAIGALFSVTLPILIGGTFLTLFLGQTARIVMRKTRDGMKLRQALSWAGLIMVAKFAELQGVLLFHARRLAGQTSTLIEHKA